MSKGRHALREQFRGLRKRTKALVVAALVVPLVAAGAVAANAVTQAQKDEAGTVTSSWFDVCVSQNGKDVRFILQSQSCGGSSLHYRWPGSTNKLFDQVGEPGADGQDGVSELETDGFYESIPATAEGEYEVVTAECAEGKYAIGGGFSPEDGFPFEDVTVIASRPSTVEGQYEVIEGDEQGSIRSTAWELWIQNETGETRNVRPWVTCAAIAD